jgi:hypothetical protein
MPSTLQEAFERPRRRVAAEVLALGLIAALFVPIGSLAASSSVWVVPAGSGSVATSSTELRFGDGFVVGYTSQERRPWGHAVCYATSTTVLSGAVAADGSIWASWYSLWDGGPSPQRFVLGDSVSPVWVGGGADCRVDLVKVSGKYLGALGFSNQTVLATTRFSVAP